MDEMSGMNKERPERQRSTAPLPLSSHETSVPIQRVRSRASLAGVEQRDVASIATKLQQEKAAKRLQAATRDKLVRSLKLTRLAATEQRTAIDHLRARRHSAAPGQGALPPGSTNRHDQRRTSIQI